MSPSLTTKIFRLPQKLTEQVRRQGLFGALDWGWHQFAWRMRERRLGINTRNDIIQGVLEENRECVDYEPLDYRSLDIIFDHLKIREGQDVFLDYGSGEGRVLIQAALHPFRKVIGVELAKERCQVSEENIRRAKMKMKCDEIEVLNIDATTLEVPSDVSVIFLFNPFTGGILQSVFDRIGESLQKHPRELTVVYVLPSDKENLLAKYAWLTETNKLPTGFWKHVECHVYSSCRAVTALQSNPLENEP